MTTIAPSRLAVPRAKVEPRGVLQAIGGTPLVPLERIAAASPIHVYAKLEALNPGGSVKDRAALNMLLDKIERGELRSGRSVVVESSSGNLGIALAQICAYYGLRFLCVVDPKTTEQNLAL